MDGVPHGLRTITEEETIIEGENKETNHDCENEFRDEGVNHEDLAEREKHHNITTQCYIPLANVIKGFYDLQQHIHKPY